MKFEPVPPELQEELDRGKNAAIEFAKHLIRMRAEMIEKEIFINDERYTVSCTWHPIEEEN